MRGAAAATGADAPTVFISHAADDPDWPADKVETLARQLQAAGADVRLDAWEDARRGRFASDLEWRDWMRASLDDARHVLCLGSARYAELCERRPDGAAGRGVAFESVQLEQWLYDAKQRNAGRIWLSQAAGAPLPRMLRGVCPVYQAPDQLDALVAHLARPDRDSRDDALARRMRALIAEECVDLYVPLSGAHVQSARSRVRVPQSTRRHIEADPELRQQIEVSEHEDLLEVVLPGTRALLLGDAGAGKTFALLEVMQRDLDRGTLPLWVKLNHWLDGDQPFEDFAAAELPDLGTQWTAALDARPCRLLIDGLNELPAEHAGKQIESLAGWLRAHPQVPVLLSCREDDLPPQALEFIRERLVIRPLRARQMRDFVRAYLSQAGRSDAQCDAVFWQLAGGEAIAAIWHARPAGTAETLLDDLLAGGAGAQRLEWLAEVQRSALAAALADPARPYAMATNPYLLAMLLWVWAEEGGGADGLPRKRVEVFGRYTRARLADETEKAHSGLDVDAVQRALTDLAARLQDVAERAEKGREAGVLALPWRDVDAAERPALELALGARLLRQEGELLRFRHQLLQEFYVARFLHQGLARGATALGERLWGADQPLWARKGWVQPFLLLAEYQHTDVAALVRTLVHIQPEVAGVVWAQTMRQAPALLDDALADEVSALLTAQMLPAQPGAQFPRDAAAFGRGLGLMRDARGRPLDRRKGVWGWYDPARGRAEVDIDWVRIRAGEFVYQGRRARITRDFAISRYPVTHSQFQAFVDDPRGWADKRWWGFAPRAERAQEWQPTWPYANHPCTRVSWWAARAYSRWLSALRGEAIGLPTEAQWERCAAGRDAAEYPWGVGFDEKRANANWSIGLTSACGLYAGGASPEGVHDLAGNVWEWCANRYGMRGNETFWVRMVALLFDRFDHGARRAVRGGSWFDRAEFCRAGYRFRNSPGGRGNDLGFRVVCCPIQEP